MPMLSKTRSFHSRCHFPLKLCSQWVGFCFFSDPTPCKKQFFFHLRAPKAQLHNGVPQFASRTAQKAHAQKNEHPKTEKPTFFDH